MNRIIRLRDVRHIPCNGDGFRPESVATARTALEARNLRFDNATGIIRDRSGELERFVNQRDHQPAASPEEVMEWQFSRYIRNSASRIERGYEP